MAFSIAATTTNKIENYTTPGDVTPCSRSNVPGHHIWIATLEWVAWFNNRRPHAELGDVPPTEYEANHYRQITPPAPLETREPSLTEPARFRSQVWRSARQPRDAEAERRWRCTGRAVELLGAPSRCSPQ